MKKEKLKRRKNSNRYRARTSVSMSMSVSVDEKRERSTCVLCVYNFHLGPLLAFAANARPIALKQRCGHTQPPFQAFENWFSILFSVAHTPFGVCALAPMLRLCILDINSPDCVLCVCIRIRIRIHIRNRNRIQ